MLSSSAGKHTSTYILALSAGNGERQLIFLTMQTSRSVAKELAARLAGTAGACRPQSRAQLQLMPLLFASE